MSNFKLIGLSPGMEFATVVRLERKVKESGEFLYEHGQPAIPLDNRMGNLWWCTIGTHRMVCCFDTIEEGVFRAAVVLKTAFPELYR